MSRGSFIVLTRARLGECGECNARFPVLEWYLKWDAYRLVVELFEDMVPLAVAYFQGRCSEGSRDTIKATRAHKLQSAFGVFFGRGSG